MKLSKLILVLACFTQAAFADGRLQQRLRDFAARPAPFLNSLPTKYMDSKLSQPAPRDQHFTDTEIAERSFVSSKSVEWSACHRNSHAMPEFLISPDPLNQFFAEFADYTVVDTLDDMAKRNWLTADIKVHPWSGDFWPIARGVLGARYFVPPFDMLGDWLDRFNYVQANPASKLIASGNVDSLSPAEKYDLLTGDTRGTFTSSQWQQGRSYYERDGQVEEWMGICHGWAPAAIMEERPEKQFTVPTRDGRQIPLYPSEVKGFLSYSWANNEYQNKQIGQRCNEKNPKTDANGRILDPACFDLDPGTWHKLVVNQLAGLGRSFIIDATYDYEVWNQPVFGYSYTYFNPETKQPADNLQDATVSRANFKSDLFTKYRSRNMSTVVGVSMKIGYTVEMRASEAPTDSTRDDQVRWVEYLYDLELDQAGHIIGGEWYHNAHPDFAWAPSKDARPESTNDPELAGVAWKNGPLPAIWASTAREAAASGVLLNTIAESLLSRARP